MKNYIIHVSTNLEREKHIRREIEKTSFDFTFINDGDIKDLTEEVLDKYFTASMIPASAGTSCTYKHILAYEDMIRHQEDYAIILEDDIYLYNDFEEKIGAVLAEIKERKLTNILVSLEESTLTYVKGSEREKGKLLYPKKQDRLAGAYLIDLDLAKTIIKEIEAYKCASPTDHLHAIYAKKGLINIYWLHSPIAIQGSLNGKITSLLDSRYKRSRNFLRRATFTINKFYKKLLYRLK